MIARGMFRLLVCLVCILGGMRAFASSPVSSVIGSASGLCMDVNNYSKATGVQMQQWSCDGFTKQQFTFNLNPDGSFQIVAVTSALCLDAGATTNSSPVVQNTCSNVGSQKWLLQSSFYEAGNYNLIVDGTQECLTVSGNSLSNGGLMVVYSCASNPPNEAFTISGIPASGPVSAVIGAASGLCMDVNNYSKTTGVQMQQWTCDGFTKQNFEFTLNPDGSYRIVPITSHLCLDAGAATSKSPVIQNTCSNATSQKWLLQSSSYKTGYFNLVADGTQECLNVSGNSLNDGGLMIVYGCDGTAANEAFTIERATASAKAIFYKGVNVHLDGYGQSDTDTAFGYLKSLYPNSLRNTVRWDLVEQSVGTYTFTTFDSIVERAIANGMRPLLVLAHTNPLYDGGNLPTSATAIAGFAKFAQQVALHYQRKGVIYEVWNEWDGAGGTPQQYINLLTPTYTAIKTVDPNAIVLGGALTLDYPSFLPSLMSLKITQHSDGISIHPYVQCASNPTAQGFANNVLGAETEIKNQNNGVLFPLYVTEIGWPTQTAGAGCGATTLANQAAYLSQSIGLATTTLGLRGLWIYDLRNDANDPTRDQANFGLLIYDWNKQPPSLSQKPSFLDSANAFEVLE